MSGEDAPRDKMIRAAVEYREGEEGPRTIAVPLPEDSTRSRKLFLLAEQAIKNAMKLPPWHHLEVLSVHEEPS